MGFFVGIIAGYAASLALFSLEKHKLDQDLIQSLKLTMISRQNLLETMRRRTRIQFADHFPKLPKRDSATPLEVSLNQFKSKLGIEASESPLQSYKHARVYKPVGVSDGKPTALYQSLFAKNTSCPFGSDLDGPKVPSPPIEPFCNCADAAQTYKKSGKVDIFATDGSVSAGRMSTSDAGNRLGLAQVSLGLPPLASEPTNSSKNSFSPTTPVNPGSKLGVGLTIHVGVPLGPSPDPIRAAQNGGNGVNSVVSATDSLPGISAVIPQPATTTAPAAISVPVKPAVHPQPFAVNPYVFTSQPVITTSHEALPYVMFDSSRPGEVIGHIVQPQLPVQALAQPTQTAAPVRPPQPTEAIIAKPVTKVEAKEMFTNLSTTVVQDLPVLPMRQSLPRTNSVDIIGHELPAVDSSTISSMADAEGWVGKMFGQLTERAYTSSREKVKAGSGNYDLEQGETRKRSHAMVRSKLQALDPKSMPPSRPMSRASSFASGDELQDFQMSRASSIDGLSELDAPARGASMALPQPRLYKTEEHHHLSSLALDMIMTEGSPSSSIAGSHVTSDTTSISSAEEAWACGDKPVLQQDTIMSLETAKLALKLAKSTEDPDERFDVLDYIFEHMADLPADTLASRQQSYALAKEAVRLLRRLALTHGHPESQYALGNFYIAGYPDKFHDNDKDKDGVEDEPTSLAHPSLEKTQKQKPQYGKAMELWVMAAKRNHANATYYVALCTEKGLGVRASDRRAVKYYRKAASLNHPGAMTRLALALLRGELGLTQHERDGVKWLKMATKFADSRFSQACLELALLHSHGIEHVILRDDRHVVELLTQGSELGNAECQWRLGKIYETQRIDEAEHSQPVVVRDGKRALHWYHKAAGQGHAPSMLEIARWYLTGWKKGFEFSKNPELAFRWAMLAAEKQLPRGMFAVGYFHEFGIGAQVSRSQAIAWYQKAAELGDESALGRLKIHGVGVKKSNRFKVFGEKEGCILM